MLFSSRSRFLLLASLATVAVLAFAGNAAASERSLAAAPPNDALSRALASGQITGAQYSLQRALAILAPRLADARYASAAAHADPREATMALRDLAARIGSLSSSDRRLAMRLLARPTDGASEGPAGYVRVPRANRKRVCTTRFCVHWVTRGSERPSLVDRNRNGRPDYIDKTVRTMNTVWRKEIGSFGYKKPRSDSLSGSHHGGNPNGRIDIFIANIGNRGLYGYCTTDDPRINRNTHRQNSAYCVFDNDFRRAEFTTGAFGLAALKVTAAHEFFHAIQFAYDTFDDRAFMEGTATWMEDEVFTARQRQHPVPPERKPDGSREQRPAGPVDPARRRPHLDPVRHVDLVPVPLRDPRQRQSSSRSGSARSGRRTTGSRRSRTSSRSAAHRSRQCSPCSARGTRRRPPSTERVAATLLPEQFPEIRASTSSPCSTSRTTMPYSRRVATRTSL